MIVVWRVTERCNLACAFCAYDRTLKRSRIDASIAQILNFGAVLAEYQRRTGDPVLVSWIGGEPLRWPALEKLTQTFRLEHGLRVSTTTNGTPLESAAVRAHLLEHYAELTVSVDALGAKHDNVRGAPGLFSRVKNGVQLLAQARDDQHHELKLRANVVLMRQTITQFPALCAELASWGIREITFNPLGGRDRPEFFPEHRLLLEQVAAFIQDLPSLRESLQPQGVVLSGAPAYLARMQSGAMNLPMPVDNCAAGESFLFIDELGRIAPCSFTGTEYGVSIDTLRTAADIQQLPFTFARARHQQRAAACDDCLSTHVFSKFATAHG